MRRLVRILIIVFMFHGFAANAQLERKEDPSIERQVLSIGAGALVGFGVGQGIEDRWRMGKYFIIMDGVAWTAIFMSLGDCNPPDSCSGKKTFHEVGLGVLLASRVLQVGELFVWGSKHGLFGKSTKDYDKSASLGILPTPDGQGMQSVFAFRF